MRLPKWPRWFAAKDAASPAKGSEELAVDSASDGLGIRGAGATSHADFGQPINQADLLFSVLREPVCAREILLQLFFNGPFLHAF